MSDRYVFAKVTAGTIQIAPAALTVPAPSPEDWQKVVEAVDAWESGDKAKGKVAFHAAVAAVRNMREAER